MNGLLAENLEIYAKFDRFYPPQNRGSGPPPSLVYSEKRPDPPPKIEAGDPTLRPKVGTHPPQKPPFFDPPGPPPKRGQKWGFLGFLGFWPILGVFWGGRVFRR